MQHICSHEQNPGNECADHAAALGTIGLVSNQNMRTRWMHASFDSTSLFAPCDNLDDPLQVLRNARPAHSLAPQRLVRSCLSVSHRVSFWSVSVSVSVFPFDRWFVMFGSVDADAPVQRKALFDNGGARHLLVLAHLSESR